MEKRGRFASETAFALLLSITGLIIVIISLGYGFGSFRRPGPGLYPFFIGLGVLVFSSILLVAGLKPKAHPVLFQMGEPRTFFFMLGAFCLWIVLMPLLGYVIVTLLTTGTICKIMRLEGWWKPVAISTGTAFFIYLLFAYWLYIDLPLGLFG